MLSKIRNASSVRNSSATRIAGLISGQNHFDQPFPRAGTIDLGGVQQLLRYQRQPGEQQRSAMNGVVFHTSARTTMASDGICWVSGARCLRAADWPDSRCRGVHAYYQLYDAATVTMPYGIRIARAHHAPAEDRSVL